MFATETDDTALAREISAIPDSDVPAFIKDRSAARNLSRVVRTLNRGALSKDTLRSKAAIAAIRKLGFL